MIYSQIYQLDDPKEKLFKSMDRIKELEQISVFRMRTFDEQIELENLLAMQNTWYSDWKDPQ